MARLKFNQKQQITFGVLAVFLGICIILSSYFGQKRFEVFNRMNVLLFERYIDWDLALVTPEDEREDVNIPEEETTTENNQPPNVPEGNNPNVPPPTTSRPTTTRPPVDDSRHFIGYLNIPKINLRRGFVDIDSRLNTVNRNIQVIYPSDMPNVRNGNMIIAAHSGNSSVSFFRDLWQVDLGDEVIINYRGQNFRYIVRNIYLVPYTGRVPIRRNANETTLTLITCTRGQRNMQTVYIAELVS